MSQMLPVAKLRPHPKNREYFGPLDPETRSALKQDIAAHGVLVPLLVTQDLVMISGHERWQIAKGARDGRGALRGPGGGGRRGGGAACGPFVLRGLAPGPAPLALAFIFNMVSGAGPGAALRHCLLGALSGGGLLWLSGLLAGGLGGGDVKLGFALGAFLGWAEALAALLFASASAAFVGFPLLIAGRARPRDSIPFGPYLALGTVLPCTSAPGFWPGWSGSEFEAYQQE